MRIALCLDCPLHQSGGVEVLVRTLIEDLEDKMEIFLVSSDTKDGLKSSQYGSQVKGHFSYDRNGDLTEQIKLLTEWGHKQRIDLFHFHLGGTFHWKAKSWNHGIVSCISRAGFLCITTNHQAISPIDAKSDPRSMLRRILVFMHKWPGKARQLSAVEHEIMVSKHDLSIQKRYFPFHANKLRQIYHSTIHQGTGIDTYDTHNKNILNLATIAFRKGQHILAEAFALIAQDFPEWKLCLIGNHSEQPCLDHIQSIASKNHLEDRILLPGPTDRPIDAITDCAIYVQPSLLEGLGLSLQEAMFHGRPSIGSNTGGIPELIDHDKSGLLVPPNEPEALASALRKLISDPPLREKFSQAARQQILAKGMTRQAMVQNYLRLYSK